MRRLRVVVAVLVVFGTVGSEAVLSASPVVAQSTTTSGLCDDTASVEQFTDVADADYGAAYMLCMRALGLSHGVGDGSYGPDRDLNRAQMASFLVRLWRDVLGNQCPTGVVSPFVDVEAGSVHATNIDCLYGLGITTGTTATTYGPQDPLKASQITRFLYRTHQKTGATTCTAGDWSELDQATACLLQLHVIPTQAEATTTTAVTRAQMGVYVIGLWHNLAGRGLPPTPPQLNQPTATTAQPTLEQQETDSCSWQYYVQITGNYDAVIEQEIESIRTDLCALEAEIEAWAENEWEPVYAAGCDLFRERSGDILTSLGTYLEATNLVLDQVYQLRDSMNDNADWRGMFGAVVQVRANRNMVSQNFHVWARKCYVETANAIGPVKRADHLF